MDDRLDAFEGRGQGVGVGKVAADRGGAGRQVDLTAEERAALEARRGEPESQQQVGNRLGVDRTTMVASIDGLEGKGLVARRPDDADRRRNVIELTAEGRATIRRATRASEKAEQRLLAGLDEDEAAQLRSLLRRIAADSDSLHASE
ncbi:MAG TPA: MarR family winged helix-turn-helix transcriptional regulator [Solirubrobacterales bacterium]|nr:MarR family winged helix-turn-helix transcriptional regulator [Solirubrobacterales bacterium]